MSTLCAVVSLLTWSIAAAQAPTVIDSTPTSAYFMDNEDVELPCTAAGQPAPKMLWWYNDTLIRQDDSRFTLSNSSLILRSINKQLTGKYQCMATNMHGKVLANPVTVHYERVPSRPGVIQPAYLVSPDGVLSQHSIFTVKSGVTLPLSCLNNKDVAPPATFQWSRAGRRIREDTIHTIDSAGTLWLSNMSLLMADSYTCFMLNAHTRTTHRVTTSMVDVIPETVREPMPMYMKNKGEQVTVFQGQNTSLVAIIVNPSSGCTFLWKRQDNRNPMRHQPSSAVPQRLNVIHAHMSDEGYYDVICKETKQLLGSVYLNVIAPAIITHSPALQKVSRGSNVTFRCRATGNPHPKIWWFRNKSTIPLHMTKSGAWKIDHSTQSLTLFNVTEDGHVTCYASNSLGFQAAYARYEVHDNPTLSAPVSTTTDHNRWRELLESQLEFS